MEENKRKKRKTYDNHFFELISLFKTYFMKTKYINCKVTYIMETVIEIALDMVMKKAAIYQLVFIDFVLFFHSSL